MGPFTVPSEARVYANGLEQISGKVQLSSKGNAKGVPIFGGALLARTSGTHSVTITSPLFKADGLSVADATAKAMASEVTFNITIVESGQVFNFFGIRSDRDITLASENAGENVRVYVVTDPGDGV